MAAFAGGESGVTVKFGKRKGSWYWEGGYEEDYTYTSGKVERGVRGLERQQRMLAGTGRRHGKGEWDIGKVGHVTGEASMQMSE